MTNSDEPVLPQQTSKALKKARIEGMYHPHKTNYYLFGLMIILILARKNARILKDLPKCKIPWNVELEHKLADVRRYALYKK